jgi:hypothetical protein
MPRVYSRAGQTHLNPNGAAQAVPEAVQAPAPTPESLISPEAYARAKSLAEDLGVTPEQAIEHALLSYDLKTPVADTNDGSGEIDLAEINAQFTGTLSFVRSKPRKP